ncbi:hypothetical protein V1277_003871 [Bradyrhizobium sp. AZCC 1588]|uniref:DUF2272 domain-containing protein n=1 Tax=unclassified Bradyrhizobium TaxID=2631580 RepID=UPI002FF423E1
MADDLEDLRDGLSASLDQLLAERDAALVASEMDKVTTAEAEADRIGVVLATVQFAINKQQAMNMNAVAARLRESVEAQRAIGLSTAAKSIEKLIQTIGGAESGGGGGAKGQRKKVRGSGPVTGDIQAKPGKHQAVVEKLIAGAKKHGLDPMMVLTFIAIESDFDPTQCSPVSSAAGLFQFIDSTWAAVGGPSFPGRGGVGNGHAAGAPVDLQVELGCAFTADNVVKLANELGQPPTGMLVYMAHQQGMAGALKIIRANQNASIESITGVAAARNNGFAGLTVGQTINKFSTIYRSNEDEARALVTIMAGADAEEGELATSSVLPKAAHIALTEMEMFARKAGATIVESREPLRSRVLEYFDLVGRPDITDPSATPWSAAFISFVLKTAGASPTEFPISPNHSRYILAGLTNRVANRMNASIVYFDRNERAPRVGDLIGFSRTASVRNRADLERLLPDTFFPSHTNLVIDVSPGKIKAIGGNLSQTINVVNVRTDSQGRIDPSDQHFFLLQMNI